MQENTGEETMSKYIRIFCDALSLKSTNRGFKLSNDLFRTYEQAEKELGYIYPKKREPIFSLYTKPLNS